MHLNNSPNNTLQFETLKTREMNPEKSPLCQLVLKLTNPEPDPDTHQAQYSPASQTPIRVNKIMNQAKDNYLEHWTNQITNQSRMNSYVTLKREYELAEYLVSVRDTKQRQILTKYRLSDHRLAVETGRHRNTWLPTEHRICGHCETEEVETEEHFLLHCPKYHHLRQIFFPKFTRNIQNFENMKNTKKMSILLGEGSSAALAAQFVFSCHDLRDSG